MGLNKMNNGRAWGISRELRDKQIRYTSGVRRLNRLKMLARLRRFWRKPLEVSYEIAALMAAIGALVALWVGWFK